MLLGVPQARREADQDAHRRVRIPAARPGHDVGGVPRRGRAHGRHASCCSAPVQRIEHDGSAIVARRLRAATSAERVEVERLRVDDAAARAGAEARPAARPRPVRAAAARLNYRDFLTVALIIDTPTLFPDNWIYVHDSRGQARPHPELQELEPRHGAGSEQTCLGLEYFCFEGDGLWTMADADLVALGAREIATIGLLGGAKVVDGTVVRMPKAYPVYDDGFMDALAVAARVSRRVLEPAGGRPQRHAQVQQPGPLDGDGAAGGARTCSASSTTSGRSTPTTSTTRSRRSTWIWKTSMPACRASRRPSRTCLPSSRTAKGSRAQSKPHGLTILRLERRTLRCPVGARPHAH